jgi:hypothetical protein
MAQLGCWVGQNGAVGMLGRDDNMEAMYRVECRIYGDGWRVLDTVPLHKALRMAAFMRIAARPPEQVRIVNADTYEVWLQV